jgi:hypothetical protein
MSIDGLLFETPLAVVTKTIKYAWIPEHLLLMCLSFAYDLELYLSYAQIIFLASFVSQRVLVIMLRSLRKFKWMKSLKYIIIMRYDRNIHCKLNCTFMIDNGKLFIVQAAWWPLFT